MTLKNREREPPIPEEIIDILRSLISRGHRGDTLKSYLSIFIHPHEFISPPVIQFSSSYYQWFRDILESAVVNTKFPEHNQQTMIVILILRAIWSSRILEVSTT